MLFEMGIQMRVAKRTKFEMLFGATGKMFSIYAHARALSTLP